MTPKHPFFVEGAGWIAAGELLLGDAVRSVNGTVRNLIEDTKNQLRSGKLTNQEMEYAQNLLSRASRALDYNERYMPPGSKPGWTP